MQCAFAVAHDVLVVRLHDPTTLTTTTTTTAAAALRRHLTIVCRRRWSMKRGATL
jgi:hypothetical protein